MKLKFYADPAHGWLAVKRQVVDTLGIVVSHYSYQRGKTVYLEEDCDAPKLLTELKKRGLAYAIVEHHTNKMSPIRSYESYRSAT